MSTLPPVAALAALVVMAGVAGGVLADPTDASPTATPTAVESDQPPEKLSSDEGVFERQLAARLSPFNLTDEQVRTIIMEAAHLREDGASRLVIRSSVVMNLYAFGVDAPFLYAGPDASVGERLAERLGDRFDLTDGQVADVAATIDRMRDAGASPDEIHRAIHAQLVGYGVDEDELDDLRRRLAHARAHHLHERAHRLHHVAVHGDRVAEKDAVDRHLDRLQVRYDLTDEQAATLERLVRGMLADGADRGAIADAVYEQLAEWGVERPTTASDRRHGSRSGTD